MNGANHRMDGISTFPFPIFGAAWGDSADLLGSLPNRGDTVVGNDVWIGYEAVVAPGISIGDGAIVAARSVVTKDVRPYAIVGGNPAIEIRRRFPDDDVAMLLAIAWWNWPIERITENVAILMAGDPEARRSTAVRPRKAAVAGASTNAWGRLSDAFHYDRPTSNAASERAIH